MRLILKSLSCISSITCLCVCVCVCHCVCVSKSQRGPFCITVLACVSVSAFVSVSVSVCVSLYEHICVYVSVFVLCARASTSEREHGLVCVCARNLIVCFDICVC